jgi:hypothetical protein
MDLDIKVTFGWIRIELIKDLSYIKVASPSQAP